MYPLLYLEGFV